LGKQLPYAQAGFDAFAGFPPDGCRQGCDVSFNLPAFAGVAQESFRVRRRVQGCRALKRSGGSPASIGIGPFGRRAQEITGFIMRAEKRLDITTQRRVAGALCRHEFVARGAGGQFDCTGEYDFSAGRRWVHRARNSGSDCNSQARRRESKTGSPSRSDDLMVVTGLIPWFGNNNPFRRGATIESRRQPTRSSVAPRRLAAESILNAGFAVRSRLRKAHPKIQIFVIRFARRFRFVFMKAGHWTWRADNLFQDRATHPGE
jgi:hypothetical protein